ncbi:protein kinase domain [Coleofasciculus chthonoplastes PCC 7420]|uniref:Protein kinase domain n=1 Tax=Coleofasciculus chthonoplastes PCC 7420 TaxID=118168 RepID=B4VRK2_9CYAN|nr:serine/threonine-protein kinase [Coleofasciculus chthonoplastes]EDX75466.1 protein kinase domain [Coleofasciculus chthonoplastes PCC 7420]
MVINILNKRYAIQKQINKNTGRRTLLARDLKTQDLVVIKLLIFGEGFQADDWKLFEREAQILKLLSHPAIPCYLDYFDIDASMGKGLALVQRYIPAKSLDQWLKDGRTFSEEEIKQLAQALLEILCYLHEPPPPVIHRDIKPSNVLLVSRSSNSVGQVYLVDFGLVQTLAAQKCSIMTVVGTYGYMPPEQFGGRTVPASDLYSLGATLIYLITGRHPADFPQKNLRIQFESFVNLSSELIDWLKWMIQPSLNRRPASAGEALQALAHPPQKADIFAVCEKPFWSRIKIKNYGDKVEVVISPKDLTINDYVASLIMIVYFGISLGLFGILPAIIVGILIKIVNPEFSDFELLHWFFVSTSVVFVIISVVKKWIILPKSCSSILEAIGLHKIIFYSRKLYFIHEVIGLKNQQLIIIKNTITKLIYIHHIRMIAGTFKEEDYTWLFSPIIIIGTEQKNYALSAAFLELVEPEMEWLAHELSKWSGVQITVEDEPQEVEKMVRILDS